MSPQDRKKLERVARDLEAALDTVRDMLAGGEPAEERDASSAFDPVTELERLRASGRTAAEARLSELRQQDLGAVFVQAGGPGADRKKPKVWLVEQVLWRLFDFERGHEAIRGRSES